MIYLTVKIHFNLISSEFQIANYNAYTYICDGMLRLGSCVPDCELKKNYVAESANNEYVW